MEYRQLGHSDPRVSAIGFGTMTFGEQTGEADSHAATASIRRRWRSPS